MKALVDKAYKELLPGNKATIDLSVRKRSNECIVLPLLRVAILGCCKYRFTFVRCTTNVWSEINDWTTTLLFDFVVHLTKVKRCYSTYSRKFNQLIIVRCNAIDTCALLTKPGKLLILLLFVLVTGFKEESKVISWMNHSWEYSLREIRETSHITISQ